MKKSQLAVLAVVIIIAGYFYFTNSGSTIKKSEAEFCINDTTSITKIYLENKNGKILLEKKNNSWTLNDTYFANQKMVDFILKTLHDIKVKELIPENQSDIIIEKLDEYSTLVEIYSYNKLLKTIYIGGATNNKQGTYMMLDGSNKPYITEVPGFSKPLTHMFTTDINVWRSKLIFHYNPYEIAEVKLNYISKPESSFTIEIDNNSFALNNQQIQNQKQVQAIQQYLMNFTNISCSNFINSNQHNSIDSVISNLKFAELSVINKSGDKNRIEAFLKPANEQHNFDPDYFFIKNELGDIMLVKYFSFDPIFRELNDFK